MKTILIVLVTGFLTLNAAAGDGFDKLYSKYSGNENITSLNLGESMIRIAAKFLGDDDKDMRDVLNSIETIKLIVSEGKERTALSGEAKNILSGEGYEELLRVNDGGEQVRVLVKENQELIKDILVYVDSPTEFVFINVTGNIDPKQVGKALKTLDIDVEGLN